MSEQSDSNKRREDFRKDVLIASEFFRYGKYPVFGMLISYWIGWIPGQIVFYAFASVFLAIACTYAIRVLGRFATVEPHPSTRKFKQDPEDPQDPKKQL